MLVLSRHKNERIVFNFDPLRELIRKDPEAAIKALEKRSSICVVEIRGDKVRIGIDADVLIGVHRDEVMQAIDREGGSAA